MPMKFSERRLGTIGDLFPSGIVVPGKLTSLWVIWNHAGSTRITCTNVDELNIKTLADAAASIDEIREWEEKNRVGVHIVVAVDHDKPVTKPQLSKYTDKRAPHWMASVALKRGTH